ncbi:g2414 [Coccomyxa elongata]
MGKRHERSLSFDVARSLESQLSFNTVSSLESASSLSSKRSPRPDIHVNLRSGGPRPPRSSFERASSGNISYGGLGTLPIYTNNRLKSSHSCSVADLCQSPPPTPKVKDVHRESLTATQRWKLLRLWPVRHWTGMLLCITLLVLLCTGLVNLVRRPGRGWSSTAVSPVILPGRGPFGAHIMPAPLRAEAAQWLRDRGMSLRPRGAPLGVCIMTADYWGLKTAGGTATAYHLLAQALASSEELQVTFLAVSRHLQQCQEAIRAQIDLAPRVEYRCLEQQHFSPPQMVETHPYEALSHAVLAWLEQNQARCDVVHAHEWGGVFVDVITSVAYRQLKPGLRVVVEAHGGHFWSTQGSVQRPLDITSLRIDQAERMGLQLADALISPTAYMTAFLKQRAWRLPKTSLVIPNVLPAPDGETPSQETVEKPVWRLAFFSRLEERKGLKLFVRAVDALQEAALEAEARFEVFFIGSDARIDMQPSTQWLRAVTASWKAPVHIMANVPRSEALKVLNQEGLLLVLCSLVDNMPYVLAEAAVKQIPLVAFDVGGIYEMLDFSTNAEAVVLQPTLEGLTAKLTETLRRGKIRTVQLSDHMKAGRDQWLKWHKRYTAVLSPQLEQEDLAVMVAVARTNGRTVQVVRMKGAQASLELHQEVCGDGNAPNLPLLLLPPGYSIIDEEQTPTLLAELMLVGTALDNGVGALTFGVDVGGGRMSWPSGPTWLLYGGDDSHCAESVPILLRRGTFCDVFLAEARVFRTYHSWVLSLMLRRAGLRMHTFPRVLFRAANLTAGGTSCNPDKAPAERHISFGSASNTLGDPEEVMVNLHLAPFPRPVSSLVADYPLEQGHKGWQVGYRAVNSSEFRPLVWRGSAEPGAKRTDGSWGCPDAAQPYPAMLHSLIHPCASTTGPTCCGLPAASFNLRFQSFVTAPQGMLLMAYEVWPICGDGFDLEIMVTSGGGGQSQQQMWREINTNAKDKPQRQKVEMKMPLHAGDMVDFLVHPHANMDCDGVYIVDIQFWQDSGDARTWEV